MDILQLVLPCHSCVHSVAVVAGGAGVGARPRRDQHPVQEGLHLQYGMHAVSASCRTQIILVDASKEKKKTEEK